MNRSEQIDQIAAALAAAQAEFDPIVKDRTVSAGKYSFDYATLSQIFQVVRKPLTRHGIAIIQDVDGGAVTTMLLHSSGQWMQSGPTPAIAAGKDAQAMGSAITYAKRYSLSAMLGVVGDDEDDDGNAAVGARVEIKDRERKQPTVEDKAKGVAALRRRWFEARAEKDTNDAWAKVCQRITDDASWDPLMLDQWNKERFKAIKAQVEAVEANPPTVDDKMREQMRQQVKGVKLAMERVQPALSDWEQFANWAGIVLDWPNMHTADLGKISGEQLKALGDAARDAVNEMEIAPA